PLTSSLPSPSLLRLREAGAGEPGAERQHGGADKHGGRAPGPKDHAGGDRRDRARERAERTEDTEHAALLLGVRIERDESRRGRVDQTGPEREETHARVEPDFGGSEADQEQAEGRGDQAASEHARLGHGAQ